MRFTRPIVKKGNSLYLLIPVDLAEYLELKDNTEIIMQDDEGKHGKFVSFWKKKGR